VSKKSHQGKLLTSTSRLWHSSIGSSVGVNADSSVCMTSIMASRGGVPGEESGEISGKCRGVSQCLESGHADCCVFVSHNLSSLCNGMNIIGCCSC